MTWLSSVHWVTGFPALTSRSLSFRYRSVSETRLEPEVRKA